MTLAFPMPEWPFGLAAPAASVTSPRGAGAGPFTLLALDAQGAHLAANPLHWRGRPFADRLLLSAADARGAQRALSRGEADLSLRPEGAGPNALSTSPLLVTVVVLSDRRPGASLGPVRRLLPAIDRAELARLFARGPSVPLATVVPPAILPALAPTAAEVSSVPPSAAPDKLTLLAASDVPDQRAVANRLQVKLFDAGVKVAVEPEPLMHLRAQLRSGGFDLALLPVTVQALTPALAAGQVIYAARGPAAALAAMEKLGNLPPEAAAVETVRLASSLDLFRSATGARATAGPALAGPPPRPDGLPSLGDLWRQRGELP